MTDRNSLQTSGTFDQALENWQRAGLITHRQAESILAFEAGELSGPAPAPAITPSTLITYIGGFLVVVASVVFVALGWEDMGDAQRLLWGTVAVACPWGAGFFLRRRDQPFATHVGAVLIAAGTVAILLFGFTLFRIIGWWPSDWQYTDPDAATKEDRANQLMMASQLVAALVAAVFAFRLRVPWMLLLTGVIGWFAWTTAIDQWAPRAGMEDPALWLMALYGGLLVCAGLVVSRMDLRQHAFWLFLSGLTATFVFLGIDSFDDALGPAGLVFLALAVVAIVLSMVIDYQIFLLYGTLGLYGWVSALVIDAFGGSRPVAFGLIVLGVVVVAAGLAWQRWVAGRIGHHDGGRATAT
jgi:hypothetical protein